jgi:hypothetical protein
MMSFNKSTTSQQDILKEILSNRNDLIAMIHEKEKIEKKISAQANVLLDAGILLKLKKS